MQSGNIGDIMHQ